jgi:hypothetical protein
MRRDGICAVVGARCRWLLPVLSLSAMALAGCGSDLYEQRLANTKILFAHEELLREHLQGKWSDAEYAISLRIPHKFEVLPPPVKPESADKPAGQEGENPEEEEVEIPDDRQPKYLNVELPGLRGAFQAKVKVIAENKVDVDGDAWIYVMSNQDMAEKSDAAKEFNMSFVKSLAEALQMGQPSSENFESARFPARSGTFVKPLKFTAVVLKPDDDIAGLTRQFSVYMYEQGEIQVIVLFVIPQNVDGSEKLTDRIPLCLETLDVQGSQIIHKTPGAGGGAPGEPKSSF